MNYVVLYFILTNGFGFLEPMQIHYNDSIIQCNLPNAVIGLQIDKLENPTKALWPDPNDSSKHCEVNIAGKVSGLEEGEYHLATTVIGAEPHIQIDPHTSRHWIKSNHPMIFPHPINLKVTQ